MLISGYYYYRTQPPLEKGKRWLLFFLRSISLAVILLLLISPIIHYVQELKEKQQIIVLNDISSSMDLPGIKGKTKKNWIQEYSPIIKDKFNLAGYEISTYDFSAGLTDNKNNTLLVPVLEELNKKHDFSRVKGIVLLSDGWLHDEFPIPVKQLGCPFYALGDTAASLQADISIVKVISNLQAYRNEPTIIRAEIHSENYQGTAKVKLFIGNTEVRNQSIQLKPGETISTDFNYRFSQTGFYPFRVEVSVPGIRERSLNNNSYPGAIEVLINKQRVVILSESPSWDNKFIVDAITENPRWEVNYYRVQGDKVYTGNKLVNTLPTDHLSAIIILNNGALQLSGNPLNYILSSYQKGIGILFQGLPILELSSLLPLQKSNITSVYQGFLELTPLAAKYPMLELVSSELQNIPPLDYYYVTALKGAEVLATIDNPQHSPAIAVSTQGKAKVMAMAFLNLWKWQMQSEKGGYKNLLTNTLTWLANISSTDYYAIYNNSYFLGEEINIRLRAEDNIRGLRLDLTPEIKVIDASQKEVFRDFMVQTEGEYITHFSLDKPGIYSFAISDQVSKQSISGKFNVAESSLELMDFDLNIPLLSWITSETGGKLLYPDQLQSFQPVPAQNRVISKSKDIPLYRKWYVITLFIVAFCLELFFRRRWGLL